MAKRYLKVKCDHTRGYVTVKCPGCKREQTLLFDSDWYTADDEGRLFPDFVCMAWRYKCFFSSPLWVVNL